MAKSRNFPKLLRVNEIFGPGGGCLVSNQVGFSDEFHCHSRDLHFHSTGETFVKNHTINACENLDLPGFPPDFDHEILCQKIIWPKTDVSKTEVRKNLHKFRRISFTDSDEKIQIPGEAGESMQSNRVAADNKVINPSCLE